MRGVRLNYLSLIIVFAFITETACLGTGNLTVECFRNERLALIKFKHGVIDYRGALSSWVGSDCCRWYGVGCDGATGHVVSLHLNGNSYDGVDVHNWHLGDLSDQRYSSNHVPCCLGGKLNSALAELRHLTYLDLSQNCFYDTRIPDFIGSLKQLRYLNLSYSNFVDMIPHHLGNLSNLNVLDLGSNSLYGDDISWVLRLLSLEYLDLSNAPFSPTRILNNLIYTIPSLLELHLSACQLRTLHLETSQLNSSGTHIRHLDLSWNSLGGTFPYFLRNMTSLVSLDLSNYDLSQSHSLEKLCNMLPSLTELYLSDCLLEDKHASLVHENFSKHSNIQLLDLRGNGFKGEFRDFFVNMSSLRSLDLGDNFLNSYVPAMPSLLTLDLSYNEIEHIGNTGMWKHCHLKELKVAHNHIQGEMIDSSTNVSQCSRYALTLLDLSLNRLNGSIPESLEKLTALETLNLQWNQLTGSIPVSLGKLVALKRLSLEQNKLSGSIPGSLGKLVSLQFFSVSSNELSGTLPSSMGQLTKLKIYDVSNNSLEGVVFETNFVNLSMLEYLDATSNPKLTFNISQKWIPVFQLRVIRLGSCKIAGDFPPWIRTQKHLKELVMSNSSISGRLPTWMRKMPIIPLLDLSHNQLSGSLANIPCRKPPIYEYQSLFLKNNLFSGPIPKSLCEQTRLEFLDLSKNGLSGQIPQCLGNLKDLRALVFSSNKLSGFIPSFKGNMTFSLTWLNLNNNSLSGELPSSLGNINDLQVLDLGDNNLSGSIPEWIGDRLRHLVILRLHKNHFTGRIPQSLCHKETLNILDISENMITGAIPRCFKELTGMIKGSVESIHIGTGSDDLDIMQVMKGAYLEYTTTLQLVINMDLSSNNLVGEIPEELTTLSLLVGLNLSYNSLSGCIPKSIGRMKSLNSLDLSENKLTGMIPSSVSELTFLSHLNLSHNNLSGQIPTGYQLQTLSDPSIYDGNKYLCGPPSQNNCSDHKDPTAPTTSKVGYKETDEPNKVWFYLDIMCGFATGFWGIIGVLLFKKQWRHRLFVIADTTMDKIHVAVAVRVSKMKRWREVA